MENEKVIAKGSGHELVKHQVGDHCNYEVRRRASAPVHRFRCHAVIAWDIETCQVVVRDTSMGVVPLEEYIEILDYKSDLLETAQRFNRVVQQDRVGYIG